MATFDEQVRSVMGEPTPEKKGIRYSTDRAGGSYYGEKWPQKFAASLPRRGDLVESENGRVLVVLDIIHTLHGTVLVLGKNIHAQRGASGGGHQSIEMEP